jgi:hypothetical protein
MMSEHAGQRINSRGLNALIPARPGRRPYCRTSQITQLCDHRGPGRQFPAIPPNDGYLAQIRKNLVALRDGLPVRPRAQLAGFAGCCLTSWPTLGRSPGQRQKHLRIGRRQVLRRPRLGHSPNRARRSSTGPRWLLARSPRTVPIPGIRTAAQAEQNAATLRLGPPPGHRDGADHPAARRLNPRPPAAPAAADSHSRGLGRSASQPPGTPGTSGTFRPGPAPERPGFTIGTRAMTNAPA